MNKDQFSGKWKEMQGKVKETWGKLTSDDIAQINGKWDQLSSKLQKKYGWNKDQAEKEMNKLCSSCCEHKGGNCDANKHGQAPQNNGRKENPFKSREEGHKAERTDVTSHHQNEKKHSEKYDHKDKKRKAG
jgi:uncharacterized protein YjbJ (UPF0337 family)